MFEVIEELLVWSVDRTGYTHLEGLVSGSVAMAGRRACTRCPRQGLGQLQARRVRSCIRQQRHIEVS